jgi:D-glycero-D-manno-heptose 1,7-bisphosphate phosphatase
MSSEPPPGQARQAAFLDRDGVLNVAPQINGLPTSPATVADMQVLPGVDEACARLKAAGFLLVMVTNQPDIANGKTRRSEVDAINEALRGRLGLDAVYMCPHNDRDNCECRKPRPGLLLAAARRWNIDLMRSYMIGDRWRDVEAGRAAGCRTVFVDHGYRERRPDADVVATSLAAVVPMLIAETSIGPNT